MNEPQQMMGPLSQEILSKTTGDRIVERSLDRFGGLLIYPAMMLAGIVDWISERWKRKSANTAFTAPPAGGGTVQGLVGREDGEQ